MFGNIFSRMKAAKPAAGGGGVLSRVFSQMRAKKAKPTGGFAGRLPPSVVAPPQRRGIAGGIDALRLRRGY